MFSKGFFSFWSVNPVYVWYRFKHIESNKQCTYPCFPGVLLTSTPHNILSKPLVFSQITSVKTMDSTETGMNPVTMTIINPRKQYWPSQGLNQRPPVLKSAMLPTELWGLAKKKN